MCTWHTCMQMLLVYKLNDDCHFLYARQEGHKTCTYNTKSYTCTCTCNTNNIHTHACKHTPTHTYTCAHAQTHTMHTPTHNTHTHTQHTHYQAHATHAEGGVQIGGRKGLEFSVVHEVTHFGKSAMINMMYIVLLPK